MRKEGRFIGQGIPIPPKPEKYDVNDPFYGDLLVKKNSFIGHVVSVKAAKTASVVVDRLVFVKKYSRYLKKSSKVQVHNPLSINAKEGDVVKVMETRPLSKTKHNVIVQVLGEHIDIKGQDLSAEEKSKPKEKQETEK